MPNWIAIEAGFLKLTYTRQLGELAACLARIKAWCLIEDSFREVVPVILDESLLYVSLLQREKLFNAKSK